MKRWDFNRTCWWRHDVWLLKRRYDKKITKSFKNLKENTLVCGDGANDLSMFAEQIQRVAFCAKMYLKRGKYYSRYKRFNKIFRTYKGLKDEKSLKI